MQEWKPFWTENQVPSLFVQENETGKTNKKRGNVIERFQKIPHIQKIDQLKADSEVSNHIVNTLFSLVVVFRYYNGDVYEELNEAVSLIELISPCLDAKVNLPTVSATLKMAGVSLPKELHIFQELALKDLACIYEHLYLVVECLFKLYDVYHAMNCRLENEMSQDLEQSKKYKQFIQRNDRIKYKIIFFIAFMK